MAIEKTKSIAQLFVKPQIQVLVEDLEVCIDMAKAYKLRGLESVLHCARAALPLAMEGQQLCERYALAMLQELEPLLREWAGRGVTK